MAKDRIVKATRGFFAEFRSFAIKGNAFELAVAVVIGAAFTGVVNSLVADVITPFLGFITGNPDFKQHALTLRPGILIKYGAFLQTLFNFLIVSFAIFIVFKLLVTARRRIFREGEKSIPQHEKPADILLLEEIRDLLKEKKDGSLG